jgi:2-polyprenyl-3-methyl-5-hydroxy-6-metoxy-1,4-benzoquinol methylase
VDIDYGKHYRELYKKHWWWRARELLILDLLRRYKPDGGWNAILDVGCGNGLLFECLTEFGKNIEGVEPHEGLVPPQTPHRHDIYRQPFDKNFRPDKVYSLILMLDVLEHLRDPATSLRHGMDLLEPEGLIVITVPAFMELWTDHDDLNHHLVRYKKNSLRKIVNQAGLYILFEKYFFQWLFPLKLITRLVETVRGSRPSVPQIPAPWVNESLLLLSRMEQVVTRKLHIPFGSSLMMVGRKLN